LVVGAAGVEVSVAAGMVAGALVDMSAVAGAAGAVVSAAGAGGGVGGVEGAVEVSASELLLQAERVRESPTATRARREDLRRRRFIIMFLSEGVEFIKP
jgi:hypothetical protein